MTSVFPVITYVGFYLVINMYVYERINEKCLSQLEFNMKSEFSLFKRVLFKAKSMILFIQKMFLRTLFALKK